MSSSPASTDSPDFHTKKSVAIRLYSVFVFCIVLEYMSVALRVVSRRLNKIRLGTDDWLILSSLIFSSALCANNFFLIHLGLGQHRIPMAKAFVLGYTADGVLYTISIFLIKLSTLFLWYRLFPVRKFIISLYVTGGVVIAYSVAQVVCIMVYCIPLSALWDPSVKGSCLNIAVVLVVYSSFNIATDICIIVLPMFQLWRLKTSLKRKLQLVVMFALGGLVLIISIVRLPVLVHANNATQNGSLAGVEMWSSLECAAATLGACLPTLRPVLLRLIGHQPERPRSMAQNNRDSHRSNAGPQSAESRIFADITFNTSLSDESKRDSCDTLVAIVEPSERSDMGKPQPYNRSSRILTFPEPVESEV